MRENLVENDHWGLETCPGCCAGPHTLLAPLWATFPITYEGKVPSERELVGEVGAVLGSGDGDEAFAALGE